MAIARGRLTGAMGDDRFGNWAEAWLAGDDNALAGAEGAPDARALAWVLKARCQQAWHSEPTVTHRAAAGLSRLQSAHAGDAEVAALAAWTAGFAALVDGDMARALGRLGDAAEGFEALSQPASAAQARVPTLMALSMLGRHDEAIVMADHLEQALARAGDDLAAGKVALNRGSMSMRQDRYADAAVSYRRAAVAFARVGDLAHSVMADIGLAGALTWQSEFAQAEQMATRAHQRAAAHDLPVLEALALGELGQLCLHRGQVGLALRSFERVVDLLAGRAPPQRQLEAERARAEAYLAAGLWPEAAEACGQLAENALRLAAPVEAAWSQLMRGQALAEAGDEASASAELVAASRVFEAQGNEVGVGRARLLQARQELRGGNPHVASELARLSAVAMRSAGLMRWKLEAELVLARAHLDTGDLPGASDLLAQVAAEAGDGPARAACELARAELAERAGAHDLAVRHGASALQRFEQLRLQVPGGDMRIASAHDAEAAGDLWVRLADSDGAPAARLLQAIEQVRARSLHDDLGRRVGAESIADDAEEGLRQRLNWLQHQVQLIGAEGDPNPARGARLQAEAKAAETAWLRRQRRTAPVEPAGFTAPATAADGLPPLDLVELVARIGPRRCVLVYHLDGERWRACVVRASGVRRHAGRVPGLARRLSSLRLQLDTLRGPGAAEGRHAAQRLARVRHLLGALYQDLVAPLVPDLAGAEQLVIVPHRALHGLPFAALGDESTGRLLDHFDLVVAPSVTSWLHCERQPLQADASALVLGVGSRWLPAVSDEARAIAAVWPGRAKLLLDGDATLARWMQLAPHAGTLHLACHASARPDNPAFSCLQLHDGVVTLADVAAMNLRAGLVVLSACETMVSRLAPGDEVLGLARGFLLAGARSVVATLWSVPDASTAELMVDFHAACRDGLGPAAAMRQAQRRLSTRYPHPFYWAPFVVHGAG